jgi:hypothetical protein
MNKYRSKSLLSRFKTLMKITQFSLQQFSKNSPIEPTTVATIDINSTVILPNAQARDSACNWYAIFKKKSMFKTIATIGFAAVIGFTAAIPAYADGVFSRTSLRIGNVSLSMNNSGTILTKTESSTGKWLGEQRFSQFKSMMWVPEQNVLFISGSLENYGATGLVKIRGTGGTGQNMFALRPDSRSMDGYNYRLGSQRMVVDSMSYNGNLQLFDGRNTTYLIRSVGGTGDNMFALQRSKGIWEDACQSMDGYNYFRQCIVK